MRITRARFKYALRACRAQAKQRESDSIAEPSSAYNYNDFWKRVNRKKDGSCNTASSIDGVSWDENIANFWRERYSSLLNSVSNIDDI